MAQAQDTDRSGAAAVVTVFGSADPREGDAEYSVAFQVGAALAGLGYAVANGGYRGTMEASARGAVEAGGEVIGVTCSLWKSSPNPYLTREERTSCLADRVGKLVELGEAGYVCLPGSTGTLVELATVWEMVFKGLLPRRPVVCVGPFWRPLIDLMAAARPRTRDHVAMINEAAGLGEHFPNRR